VSLSEEALSWLLLPSLSLSLSLLSRARPPLQMIFTRPTQRTKRNEPERRTRKTRAKQNREAARDYQKLLANSKACETMMIDHRRH
jgi:hypothetical protein